MHMMLFASLYTNRMCAYCECHALSVFACELALCVCLCVCGVCVCVCVCEQEVGWGHSMFEWYSSLSQTSLSWGPSHVRLRALCAWCGGGVVCVLLCVCVCVCVCVCALVCLAHSLKNMEQTLAR